MKRRAAAPPPRRIAAAAARRWAARSPQRQGQREGGSPRAGAMACGSASPAAARQPAAADDHGCVCDGMAAPGYGCVPSCPCEYEVEDRDRCHIDAPAMRFGWCWVVFLHTECDAGARRQACQPAEQKIMAQKWVRPWQARDPPTTRRAAKPRANLRQKLNSFGFIETTISEAIGAACRPPPQEAAHARAGRVRGHFSDAVKAPRPRAAMATYNSLDSPGSDDDEDAAPRRQRNDSINWVRGALLLGLRCSLRWSWRRSRPTRRANGAMKRSDAAALARQKHAYCVAHGAYGNYTRVRARREPLEAGLRAVAGLWVCGAPRRESMTFSKRTARTAGRGGAGVFEDDAGEGVWRWAALRAARGRALDGRRFDRSGRAFGRGRAPRGPRGGVLPGNDGRLGRLRHRGRCAAHVAGRSC